MIAGIDPFNDEDPMLISYLIFKRNIKKYNFFEYCEELVILFLNIYEKIIKVYWEFQTKKTNILRI